MPKDQGTEKLLRKKKTPKFKVRDLVPLKNHKKLA